MENTGEDEQISKRLKMSESSMEVQAGLSDVKGATPSVNMGVSDDAISASKGQVVGDDQGDSNTCNMQGSDETNSDLEPGSMSTQRVPISEQQRIRINMAIMEEEREVMNRDMIELQKTLAIIKEQNEERDLEFDLLVQTTIKKDKDIITMRSRLLDLEKRSMNRNVRVQNLPEQPKENAAEIFKNFLGNKLDPRKYDIEIAHRNGPKFEDENARARPMIIQMTKRGMVENILKATKTEGAFNKDSIRVSRQVPTELRHATAKLHHLADIAKKIHPSAKIETKDRAIYINGQKRRPPLTPPHTRKHPLL
jgi:hypothetical protein